MSKLINLWDDQNTLLPSNCGVCVLLSAGLWLMSKLLGVGVLTLNSDPSKTLAPLLCLTFYYISRPTCLNCFYTVLGSLLRPTAPPSLAVRRRCTSLLHPLPISSPETVRCPPRSLPHLPPNSFRRLSLLPAPRALSF